MIDNPSKEAEVKYAMLIYPKPGSHEGLGEEGATALTAEYLALRDDSRCVGGAHLQPVDMATTVRHGGAGNLITDGPYADAKEVLGGYYVLEAADLDAALEFAQRIPAVRLGGAVEVRPLVEIPGRRLTDRAGLPARVGPGPRVPGRLPRRHRPRRGGRPGGVCDRGRAVAPRGVA